MAKDEALDRRRDDVARLKVQIVDSAIDYGILSIDLAGIITTWNEGARRIFGWPAHSACGQLGEIIFTEEDRARGVPDQEIGVALKTGRSLDERWHLRSDGTRFWASGEMQPLVNEAGETIGLMKIVRDRTEQWLSEQRQTAILGLSDQLANLAEWSQMTAAAARSVGIGLTVDVAVYFTADGDGLKAEGAWYSSSDTDVLAKAPPVQVSPELDQGRPVCIAKTGPTGLALFDGVTAQAYAYIPVIEHHKLAAVFAIYSRTPREWTTHEVGFVAAIASRTRAAVERRKAEMALSELAAGLEREVDARVAERNRLWASTSDLMATLDAAMTFVDLNPAWSAVLGWPVEALLARQLLDLVRDDSKLIMEHAVRRVAEADAVTGIVCWFKAQDGTSRAANCSMSVDQDRYYLVARDITMQVGIEDRLRQSQKMDALGQLTGGIAHDFNNHLTGVIGSLDLIRVRLNSGRAEDVERLIRAARTAAHRAAALTRRLLVFARQQPLDPKPVDVNALITGMQELLRRTLHEGIRLEVVLASHRWSAMTDAHQLENAVLNLVINARDAMHDGGELRIAVEECTLDEGASVSSDRIKSGDYVCISVTDTGCGMPPDVLAKVFEPFFTTKPAGQGTGLGLAMIYGLARQSEGDVRISSEVGRGTTVRLYLPRAEQLAVPVVEDAASAPPRSKGESVFVVEDDITVRLLLGEVLDELGYRKVEAPDGRAALPILRSDLPIDLLITDLGLPFVNGRQLAQIARERRPGLKVLFITGYADAEVVEKAQGEHDAWFLVKPVGLDQLAAKLREIFDQPG